MDFVVQIEQWTSCFFIPDYELTFNSSLIPLLYEHCLSDFNPLLVDLVMTTMSIPQVVMHLKLFLL